MAVNSAYPLLFNNDNLVILNNLEPESVDVVIADPPYFQQLGGDLTRPDQSEIAAVDDAWDKYESEDIYESYTHDWLLACRRVLKRNGTLWAMGSYHNIPVMTYRMRKLGFWTINEVIWNKLNPMPNMRGTRFTAAHENIYWVQKEQGQPYTFNYQSLKMGNEDKQMRSVWHLPICSGNERLKGADGKKLHSTQKPEALITRMVLASTKPGDVVLDPFMGTGTTGAVCQRYGRRFIGIEQDDNYYYPAAKRILGTPVVSEEQGILEMMSTGRAAPKVAISQVVDAGYIQPGSRVYLRRNESLVYYIRADGVVINNIGEFGSIHQMAAKGLSAPSANGWTEWYLKDGDQWVVLDDRRQQYLKDNGLI